MGHFSSIRWRIAIPYTILILATLAGLVIYLSDVVRATHLADLEGQLATEARLLSGALAERLAQGESGESLDAQARRYAELVDARVTLIGVDGTVLGESHEDRTQMENHLYRPEVQQALAKGWGSSVRFSRTMEYDMMYVAVPATVEGRIVGIVRVALPLRQIEANVARLRQAGLSATLVIAVTVVLLALLLAERTARPVRQLTEVVQRLAAGDLSARLLPVTRDEVGTLTRAFNQMSDRLRGTIDTLIEERSRLTAVLDNMADGVLITDGEGYVRLVNPAVLRFLGVAEEIAMGRPFAQVVRDHRLIDLWQRCCERGEEQFDSVEMGLRGPFLHAIVTPLRDAGPQAAMVILQDLTRLRHLETVRRDFISNISHELRTPLASLKALVDTLRDGALEDPPAAHRFLERMDAEVDALTQMVEELLELSRIESGQAPFRMEVTDVADILGPPIERLRPQAERADLQLSVELSPALPPVLADAERMRQVVTNLVHNAIKFTPAGGSIMVKAVSRQVDEDIRDKDIRDKDIRIQGAESLISLYPDTLYPYILVSVQDTGVGIPAEDLPRIFERFYKADRARSGGGTGLGLAIARHIVQAHGGQIWAESREGRGSTFYFTIPIRP